MADTRSKNSSKEWWENNIYWLKVLTLQNKYGIIILGGNYMLNQKRIEKLLTLIGAIKVSDLRVFIEDNNLKLDEYEMHSLLARLYEILERC